QLAEHTDVTSHCGIFFVHFTLAHPSTFVSLFHLTDILRSFHLATTSLIRQLTILCSRYSFYLH
ncbi:hypothetical protein, partial [Escherichia coli]|uniref:hypothetical protein n=1 Tax=Escherichia coli TaxID=562 RepID=UPI001BC8C07C